MNSNLAFQLYPELEHVPLADREDIWACTLKKYNDVRNREQEKYPDCGLPEITTKKQAIQYFKKEELLYPAHVIHTLLDYYKRVLEGDQVHFEVLVKEHPFQMGIPEHTAFYKEIFNSLYRLKDIRDSINVEHMYGDPQSSNDEQRQIENSLNSINKIRDGLFSVKLAHPMLSIPWEDANPTLLYEMYLLKRRTKLVRVLSSLLLCVGPERHTSPMAVYLTAHALSDTNLITPESGTNTPTPYALWADYLLATLQLTAVCHALDFVIPGNSTRVAVFTCVDGAALYPTLKNTIRNEEIITLIDDTIRKTVQNLNDFNMFALLPLISTYVHETLALKESRVKELFLSSDTQPVKIQKLISGHISPLTVFKNPLSSLQMPGYSGAIPLKTRLAYQERTKTLPFYSYVLTIHDSCTIEIPCFMAINNYNLFSLLIPNSSGTASYMSNLYSCQEIEPLKGYGPLTKYFTRAETAAIKTLFNGFRLQVVHDNILLLLKAGTPELVNINQYTSTDKETEDTPEDIFWEIPFVYVEYQRGTMTRETQRISDYAYVYKYNAFIESLTNK